MLKFRSILLSGLVTLLMLGMVSAAGVQANAEVSPVNESDDFIGIYVGSWMQTEFGRECDNTEQWRCIRIIADFNIPW